MSQVFTPAVCIVEQPATKSGQGHVTATWPRDVFMFLLQLLRQAFNDACHSFRLASIRISLQVSEPGQSESSADMVWHPGFGIRCRWMGFWGFCTGEIHSESRNFWSLRWRLANAV